MGRIFSRQMEDSDVDPALKKCAPRRAKPASVANNSASRQ